MQNNEILRARVVANFLLTARRHFGLPSAVPSSIRVPAPLSRLRPLLRSLLVVSSLGTLLTQPSFAIDTLRPFSERDTAKNSNEREPAALPVSAFATLAEKSSKP